MSGPRDVDEHFRPLRPASGWRLRLATILGPLLWLVAIMLVGIVVHRTAAIAVGLLVMACSFAAAIVGLLVLRSARDRERRRYADRG